MEIRVEQKVSVVRACRIIELDRSMYYYESQKDDSEVESKLRWYAEHLPHRGFPEYYKRIHKEGIVWNHKRVRRIYLKLGLNRKRKARRRIPNPAKQTLVQPLYANLTWSIDFMEDRLENGRKVRTLNILDDYNREALAIEIDYSFPSSKVVQVLEQVMEWRGKPTQIRTDNGTEFIAKAFEDFCIDQGITHLKIQKGKPNQNGFIERFNRAYREDVLDANIFENIRQVRELTQDWMEDYNMNHPHSSLGNLTPIEFIKNRTNLYSLNL